MKRLLKGLVYAAFVAVPFIPDAPAIHAMPVFASVIGDDAIAVRAPFRPQFATPNPSVERSTARGGFDLPEPGRWSGVLATLALAAFYFARRVSR